MAGHSQFANIKHRKGAQDKKRASIFTKLSREITVAAKQGLPDPDFNPRLRSAIAAARKENLPKDRIESAIKAASKNTADENYEEVQYEGYGPSGLAFIVHTLTNNRNRTASEIRHAFSKAGGNLGESGSVSFLFQHVGMIVYYASNVSYDDLFSYAVDLDIIDISEDTYYNEEENSNEKIYKILCNAKDFGTIRDKLIEKFSDPDIARLSWQPLELIQVTDQDTIEKVTNLMDVLEDNDDVQYVEVNFAIDSKE